MGIREQNLQGIGAVYATFDIHQVDSVDELTDDDIGKAVALTNNNECGLGSDGVPLLGMLMTLSPVDSENGKRKATVQISGIMTLPITSPYPVGRNKVVIDGNGNIKQAPALTGYDPAGGNVGRGMVIAVQGTTKATLILS